MQEIYLTTDWHLNHPRIIQYENRPDNYQDLILSNYKSRVTDEDIVINLGDVIFHQPNELFDCMKELPGYKVLVIGNHDRHTKGWFRRAGFDYVCKSYEYKNILFTHKPFDLDLYPNKNIKYNIHGHLHTKSHNYQSYGFYSNKHLKVSVEELDYKMITLNEFMSVRGKLVE